MVKLCSICGKEYKNLGNDAAPVSPGRCCDECNAKVVIPERVKQFNEQRNKDDKGE